MQLAIDHIIPYEMHWTDIMARPTEIFPISFIPSSVTLWNNLPPDIKSLQSLSFCKSRILQSFNVSDLPKYYLVGDRNKSDLQTRIRNQCSDLNFHLYLNHIKDNASCSCGYQIENAEHFFFHSPRYTDQRIQLFRDLHILHPLNRNILLYGSNDQYDDVFNHTFLSVHSFIRNSKRFDRRHS